MHDRPEILIGEGDLFKPQYDQDYESEPKLPMFPESSREVSQVITPPANNSESGKEQEKDKKSDKEPEIVSPTPVESETCKKLEESSIQ